MRFAVFLLFVVWSSAEAGDFIGRWEGSLQIPGNEYRLILDLDRIDGKGWGGSIIIPGLGLKGVPLSHFTLDGSQFSFALDHALASPRIEAPKFQCHLSGSDRLTGDFIQAGNKASFTLTKTGPPQVEVPRQSTAIGKDFVGQWKGDYEMNGYPRHVTVTLANHDSGPATAQFVIVGKRTTEAPVNLVTDDDGFLTIESQEIGIGYEGRLRNGEIRGTFTLGSFELPLVLQRAKTE
jgi:hypothetical protein